jgi:nucleotide-binding universal stress UspA family protein
MKSILVPLDQSETTASAVRLGTLLARSVSGKISGVALRPVQVQMVAPDPIVLAPTEWDDARFVEGARLRFEKHCAAAGSLRFQWLADASIDDAELGSLARVYDITVVGRPSGAGPRLSTVESALFESGQPVLIAPPVPPEVLGENIVISWNCSTEQAKATAFALPLLMKARQITILTIDGLTVPGPAGALARDWLAHHGIKADEISMGNGGQRPGAVLLAEARKLGADLIIKGAYTQSRLRQMIFGGATSHLLAHSTLPMLMAR